VVANDDDTPVGTKASSSGPAAGESPGHGPEPPITR